MSLLPEARVGLCFQEPADQGEAEVSGINGDSKPPSTVQGSSGKEYQNVQVDDPLNLGKADHVIPDGPSIP